MGMTVPPAYGGQGRALLDVVLAIEQVARVCGVTGRVLVDSNLGPVGAIVHYGSEAQKRKHLPRVVQGDKPAIAISEPRAGSAASGSVLNRNAMIGAGDLTAARSRPYSRACQRGAPCAPREGRCGSR